VCPDWPPWGAPVWFASCGGGRSMITGVVNPNREAIIRLMVAGPGGQQQDIEAIINTGFTGFLTLPPALVAALGLPWLSRHLVSWRMEAWISLTCTW
jgi:hypothetical protein